MTASTNLCDRCMHARVVTSGHGSRFLRCGRSDTEPEYVRYPQLPVESCDGFSSPQVVDAPVPLLSSESRQPLFHRLGGRDAVERVVAELYRRIELDPELRPLFPDDLQAGRDNQILFFEQWLGGEARYTALRGSPRLKKRHQHFPIDEHTASRWLGHMADALRACQVDDATTEEILAALDPLARHFINQVPTGAG